MIGIEDVASYICEKRISNMDRVFDGEVVDKNFIERKVGVYSVAVKEEDEHASDLCVKAFNNLLQKHPELDKSEIECICVCSQNRDFPSPHVSAVVHSKIGLNSLCAVFDISLGCTGYVQSLNIFKCFMEGNGFKKGLLFTSDPGSDIVEPDDKNTALLFGDGATVTLLSENYTYKIGSIVHYVDGSLHDCLIKRYNEPISMDGRVLLFFALTHVYNMIKKNLEQDNVDMSEIDLIILHQASKYLIDEITRRAKIDKTKVPFDIWDYGNTSSSSIPIILEKNLAKSYNKILMCGFGVGLSIASTIIYKKEL